MHVTGEITLGTLLTIATLIGIAISFGRRFGSLEAQLASHGTNLVKHAERMDRYEEHYMTIAGQMQRIIGRIEEQDKSPFPRNRRINGK